MTTYNIQTTATQLRLTAPYNPNFIGSAKEKFEAKWDGECWCFDIRDRDMVLKFSESKYGWQMGMPLGSVTIDFFENRHYSRGPCILLGRVIAAAKDRDSGARLGDGVRLVGGVATSGGSSKNWTTEIRAGSEFVVHDVPEKMAQDYITGKRESRNVVVTLVVPPLPIVIDKTLLEDERSALMQRLTEIDTQLV